jgi:hypothetical protein
MRSGIKPIEMLIPEWLPRGTTVWIASEPEAGKTWICLWLVAKAMRAGLRVAYLDAELGPDEIVRRLLLLGCDPAVVDDHLDYLPFPSWSLDDAAGWDEACAEHRWDLVVFETASDFLSDAGLNENDGLDVTEWTKAFPERVRVHGGTALVSDHVRKDGVTNGYAVGSRAKKAKSQLGYEIASVRPYDADTVGAIAVTRTKNTLSAPVTRKRTFDIGPIHGKGTFDIRSSGEAATESDQNPLAVMADVMTTTLWDGGHVSPAGAITQRQLCSLVSGNDAMKRQAAQLAATSPVWPVVSFAKGAQAVMYYATARERSVELKPRPTESELNPDSVGSASDNRVRDDSTSPDAVSVDPGEPGGAA